MKLRKSLFALIIGLGIANAQEQAPKAQNAEKNIDVKSFKASVLEAVKNHPQTKKLESTSKVALHDINIADGGFLPTVDFRSSNGYENSQNETVENDDDYRRTLFRRENSLTVRQLLYDGGETSSRVERNTFIYNRSKFTVSDNNESLALRAVVTYLDVLRVEEQVELSRENILAHRGILKLVEARLKEGVDAKSDKVQVDGRLALAEAQLRRDLADLESARARFKEVYGYMPGKLSPVDEADGIPKELREAQNVAAVSHPAILASKESIKSANANVAEAKTKYKPRVHLELTGIQNDNVSGSKSNNEEVSAMVVFTYNFYNGGRDEATIQRELARKEQESEQLFETQRVLVRDVTTAWYANEGKKEELKFFVLHQKASDETYKAYQNQYKLSKRTLFDLLNARSEYFRSRFSVIDAKYTIKSSEFRILAAMGALVKFLNK